jgi:hypothetical protein
MERRAVIKFCVKLKKTVTETFEILKSAYSEEVCREQECLNDIKGTSSESENVKIADENNVDCIF